MTGGELEQNLRSDSVGQVSRNQKLLACRCCSLSEVKLQHILRDDGDAAWVKLGAEIDGECGVQFDGQNMSGARGKCSCDRSCAGADLDDGSAADVSERRGDTFNGLGVVEEVLA